MAPAGGIRWADLFQWQPDKSQRALTRPGEQGGGSGDLPLLPALTGTATVQAELQRAAALFTTKLGHHNVLK